MPAASVFFFDLDGNLLEYIAMLPHQPRPEQGIVQWSVWEFAHRDAPTSESSQSPQ
jgi:hypothetical protein